ncbi:MAG: hypothetical protein JWM48_748 [Mycobacterium sp.]|jgi:hypothetical protein|nr:hypothetical protein [Mycobacterium sp.]MCW2744198.1 hypothetical protein [Mycobacterium sp.]
MRSKASGRSGTTLLGTEQADPRVESTRRRALQSYVDGTITFAEAEDRVRRALVRAAEEQDVA